MQHSLQSSLSPARSPHPGASPLPQDPLAVSVVTQCETLKALVSEWEDKVKAGEGGGEEEEVRMWILPETKEFLISWLSNKKPVSIDTYSDELLHM